MRVRTGRIGGVPVARRALPVVGWLLVPALTACAFRQPLVDEPAPSAVDGRAFRWVSDAGPAMDSGSVRLLRTEAAAYLEREGWRYAPDDTGATRIAVFVEGVAEQVSAARARHRVATGAARGRAEPFAFFIGNDVRVTTNGAAGVATPLFAGTSMPNEGARSGPPGPPPVWTLGLGLSEPWILLEPPRPPSPSVDFARLHGAPPTAEPAPIVESGHVVLVVHGPDGRRRLSRSTTQVKTLAFWGAWPSAVDTTWTRLQFARAVDEIVRVPAR